jgi:hypothetical protein
MDVRGGEVAEGVVFVDDFAALGTAGERGGVVDAAAGLRVSVAVARARWS